MSGRVERIQPSQLPTKLRLKLKLSLATTTTTILDCCNTLLTRMSSYGYSVVHRKDMHLTRIVVTIVLVFLFLNSPRLVLGVYEISR